MDFSGEGKLFLTSNLDSQGKTAEVFSHLFQGNLKPPEIVTDERFTAFRVIYNLCYQKLVNKFINSLKLKVCFAFSDCLHKSINNFFFLVWPIVDGQDTVRSQQVF